MLVKEGITNIAVVVTRYFGGIKLGTGGLVRAYTGSAKLGLEAAGLCVVKEMAVLSFKLDYSFLSKAQNMEKKGGFYIEDITYAEAVTLKIVTNLGQVDTVKELFANLTAGSAALLSEEISLEKNPV